MKNIRGLVVLGLLAAAAAGPAAAQDKGMYFGGALGVAQYLDSCQNLLVVCDDRDAGWRAFGGYQLNRWVAVEAGYVDLGKITFSGDVAGVGFVRQETSVRGFDLVAVVYIPLVDRVSAYGKVGGYRARVASDIDEAGVPSTRGETSGGLAFGLGAETRLGGIGIRLEALRYENVGGQRSGEDSIMLYNAALLWRF